MSTSLSTQPSVAAQIARLPELPMAEIRALWQKLVGGDTPTHNRQFLERRIAYRLQELEFRKVDANLLDRNQRRIESLVETGKVKKRDRDYRPAAGTALVREYKGVEYRVIATAEMLYYVGSCQYIPTKHNQCGFLCSPMLQSNRLIRPRATL